MGYRVLSVQCSLAPDSLDACHTLAGAQHTGRLLDSKIRCWESREQAILQIWSTQRNAVDSRCILHIGCLALPAQLLSDRGRRGEFRALTPTATGACALAALTISESYCTRFSGYGPWRLVQWSVSRSEFMMTQFHDRILLAS